MTQHGTGPGTQGLGNCKQDNRDVLQGLVSTKSLLGSVSAVLRSVPLREMAAPQGWGTGG